MNNLYKEISHFKKWAKKHYPQCDEEHDNGEWEMGYNSHFDEMCEAAISVIENYDASEADEKLIDALLYVTARDNEIEGIADELTKHGEWFRLLSKKSINSDYTNAKWQFAKRLSVCEYSDKELIFEFLDSDNEYTSRMSLMTLAEIYPGKAEEYALKFWHRNKYKTGTYEDEYQKIMVLHVLDKIKSDKLEEYLNLAANSDYVYLKENAETIRNRMCEEM
ncbi:MAG: hypothetical protein IJL67_11480 [Oscillospiraceae bacterium]|nr:hypothetical protein [Oscillospiraceae bacterium]